MEKHSKFFSLEEIAQKRYPVLFDTSVIIQPLNKDIKLRKLKTIKEKILTTKKEEDFFLSVTNYIKKEKITTEEKILTIKKERDFFILMRNYIEKSNFYISDKVIEELRDKKIHVFEDSKEMIYNFPKHQEILNLYRIKMEKDKELSQLINERNQELSQLINAFIDNDRIFKLNERHQDTYRDFYRKFAYFMDNKIMGDKVLHETDFDLQIKGISRAKNTGPIALASNDLKIFHASEVILKEEDIQYRVEFFIRERFLSFKRICDSFEEILNYV